MKADRTLKVVFTPSGMRGSFPAGITVLQAARELGVDLDSVCGGRGICGRCQVKPATGEFAKHGITSLPDNLSLLDAEESANVRLGEKLKPGHRLGCLAKLLGDCVIDIPRESQIHRQVIRKEAELFSIELDPPIRLYYVEVQQPKLEEGGSDLRRLTDALSSEWGLSNPCLDDGMLRTVQRTLREADWKVTAAVDQLGKVRTVFPGYRESLLGMAVDVGSTTIAAHLCDIKSGEILATAGIMNPQIRFGEDLMSRVSYVMMNPGGDLELTKTVREAINQLTEEVTEKAGVVPEDVIEAVFVGNPIMHHLLHGISPVELGVAPFALATDGPLEVKAGDIDLRLHLGARTYTLPCIAGHVGADTAAMILAESPHHGDKITLLVDVGTNAEIVLGNSERLLAASSPTGPAFEGAQITRGQRAAPGAIERVRIDRETLRPRFKVIGCDLWSDDPDFKNACGKTGITGICGSGIIEAIAEMYLSGIVSPDGMIDGTHANRTTRVKEEGPAFCYVLHEGLQNLAITQNDVRAVQLAKAALYAGIRLLMEKMGIESVDRIRLAGAFGSRIDVKYAMVLGMIPDCNLEDVSSAGNAAGTGARIALLNYSTRKDIEKVVRVVEKVETAVEPEFQSHFVSAMAFPHRTDAFPHLSRHVELPPPVKSGPGVTNNRRRKRRRVQAA